MGALYDFLFGKSKYQVNNEYQNALKDAGAQRAKAVEQAVQDRKTYDANKDYFTKMGVKDPGYASDVSKAYADEMGKIEDARKQAWKENRYKNDGTGMIGALTTPYYHTADFAKDLFTGNLGNRYSGGGEYGAADPLSDLGALGEVAFDVAGMGALGNAVRGGTKLMSNVGKTALRTGLLGAGENAFSTLREGGSNTNLGDLALSAGIGGVVGGGLGGLSQLGGNAANIAKTVRSPQMKTLNNYYQQALAGQAMPLNASRMLGDGVGGASVGTAGNYLDWVPTQLKASMERSNTPLAKTGLGRVKQGFADSKTIYGSPLSSIANSRVGNTAKNILSTPAGKIGAGVGGGLLIAKLLSGGGKPEDEGLTDDELYQLLNNYNNGGY